MAVDFETDVGKVRLLISDVGGDSGSDFLFPEDKEVQVFVDLKGDVQLAAALALRTIAANTAQVMKVIKFMELTTNGAETAKALLKDAEEIEKSAENGEDYVDVISTWGDGVPELAEAPVEP